MTHNVGPGGVQGVTSLTSATITGGQPPQPRIRNQGIYYCATDVTSARSLSGKSVREAPSLSRTLLTNFRGLVVKDIEPINKCRQHQVEHPPPSSNLAVGTRGCHLFCTFCRRFRWASPTTPFCIVVIRLSMTSVHTTSSLSPITPILCSWLVVVLWRCVS